MKTIKTFYIESGIIEKLNEISESKKIPASKIVTELLEGFIGEYKEGVHNDTE